MFLEKRIDLGLNRHVELQVITFFLSSIYVIMEREAGRDDTPY